MIKQKNVTHFFNRSFDKNRLKNLINWFLKEFGETETINLLESLKQIGFHNATKAGISLSIDDLLIPDTKIDILKDSELKIQKKLKKFNQGDLTNIERFQHIIDTWNFTSEKLKNEVVNKFRKTNTLNPVYMMAFSGARGNLSQVRQLVGMRGLMSDPQGQIINYPISSNFREGLTLTEYVISCYGARKGIVDTALRTANSGYLTRRLVDVAQHIMISSLDCGTDRNLKISSMKEGRKTLLSLKDRVLGRVLGEDIPQIGKKNQLIDSVLATKIESIRDFVYVRSPLTCNARDAICQLCYGWSLAHNQMVSLGEAVGIIAAQSIGEPGTQLTMRTFHTGGVFSGDAFEQVIAPFDGILFYQEKFLGELIRTTHGNIAFLIKTSGKCKIISISESSQNILPFDEKSLNQENENKEIFRKIYKEKNLEFLSKCKIFKEFDLPEFSILYFKNFDFVKKNQIISEYAYISTQTDQKIQVKESINAPIEGQVFFEDVAFSIRESKNSDILKIAREYGSLWILAGNIQDSITQERFYPKSNDFLFKSAPLTEHFLVSSKTGYIYLPINFYLSKKKSFLKKIPKDFSSFQNEKDLKSGLITTNLSFDLVDIYWTKNSYKFFGDLKKSFLTFYLEKELFNSASFLYIYHIKFQTSFFKKNSKIFPFFSIFSNNHQNAIYRKNISFVSSYKEIFISNINLLDSNFCRKNIFLFSNNSDLERLPIFLNFSRKKNISTLPFLVINQWLNSNNKIFVIQNRQGCLDLNSNFVEGFLKVYSFFNPQKQRLSNQSKEDISTSANWKLENSLFTLSEKESNSEIEKTKKNSFLFSLIPSWPYLSKNEQIKFYSKKDKKNTIYKKGQLILDDIFWESNFTSLHQVKRNLSFIEFWKNYQLNENQISAEVEQRSDKDLKINESKIKNIFSKISLHLDNYSISQKNTLWLKTLQKQNSSIGNEVPKFNFLEKNTIYIIKRHFFTSSNRNFKKIEGRVIENLNHQKTFFCPQKNLNNLLRTKEHLYFTKNYKTIFHELITNPQCARIQTTVQKEQIFIYNSIFSSLILNKKANSIGSSCTFFIKQIPEALLQKRDQETLLGSYWKTSGFLSLHFRLVYIYPLHKTLQKIICKKKQQVIFKLDHLKQLTKNQIFAKRQHLGITEGEVFDVSQNSFPFFEKNIERKNTSSKLVLARSDFACFNVNSINLIGEGLDQKAIFTLLTNFFRTEQKILKNYTFSVSGQILSIRENNGKLLLVLRKGQPCLFSSRSIFHVFHNNLVKKENLLVTLFYKRLQSGDIVQGIPKIEEFFEARSSKFGEPIVNSVPIKLEKLYQNFIRKMSFEKAVRLSIQTTQQFLVDSVQQVYQTQGVSIADKHLEIIIRQMTSKVRIIDGAQTGLLPGELINLETIELINAGTESSPARYEPVLLGITKASLETKSFISAASFQETTRILAKAAIEKKTDFLKGLKENVILGHLIPVGTGFRDFFYFFNKDE